MAPRRGASTCGFRAPLGGLRHVPGDASVIDDPVVEAQLSELEGLQQGSGGDGR